MCNFLSALVLRDGTVLCEPFLESHSDLIRHFQVKERDDAPSRCQNFVKVEFRPLKGDPKIALRGTETDHSRLDQPDAYRLVLDEEEPPSWWCEEVAEKVAADLRRRIERMIVRTAVPFLMGGCFILSAGAEIGAVLECRVSVMCGGTINEVRGGTIGEVWGGTINEVWGGVINEVRGGTINSACGGTINSVWGGTINKVWEGGEIVRNYSPSSIKNDMRSAEKIAASIAAAK